MAGIAQPHYWYYKPLVTLSSCRLKYVYNFSINKKSHIVERNTTLTASICVCPTRKVSRDVTATSGKAGSTRVAAAELSAQSSYRATSKLIFFRLRCFFFFPGEKLRRYFLNKLHQKRWVSSKFNFSSSTPSFVSVPVFLFISIFGFLSKN